MKESGLSLKKLKISNLQNFQLFQPCQRPRLYVVDLIVAHISGDENNSSIIVGFGFHIEYL